MAHFFLLLFSNSKIQKINKLETGITTVLVKNKGVIRVEVPTAEIIPFKF